MPRLIPPDMGNGWRPTDSRHGPGSVPVLDISEASHERVGEAHADGGLLTGAIVQFDHPEGAAIVYVGGSTLYEAATEVVNCVGELGRQMPAWVASTDEDLAAIVAEHFTVKGYSTCKIIDLSKVAA